MKTWQFYLRLFRFQPLMYTINLIGIVGAFLLEMVPGLLTREFFNMLSSSAPARFSLITLIALLFAGALGRMFFYILLPMTNTTFVYTCGALLRKNMLARILQRPGARALPSSSGEAVSRFRDDIDETLWSVMYFNDVIALTAFTVVGLTIMMSINAWITLAVLLPLALIVVVTQRVAERIEQYRKASREATGAVTGFLGEIFGAVQAIKVAGAETQVIRRFGALNDQRRITGVRDKLFNEILKSIFANAVNIGTGLILLLAATSMRAGTFTVGDFALFVYYLGWISEFTAMFGIVLTRYRQAGVSFERMVTLLQGAPPQSLVAYGPVYMRGALPAHPRPTAPCCRPAAHDRGRRADLPLPRIGARHRRRSICGWSADRSPCSPAGSDRAKPRCCARCWACCRPTPARCAGMARASPTRPNSSSRRAAPTPRRCRACSAIR